MKTELQTLLALGESRRAAGLPCNPRRDPDGPIDWLTEQEIQTAHCLTLRIALVERLVETMGGAA